LCGHDILLLTLLGSASEQDYQALSIASKVDAIAGAPVDASLKHPATHRFHFRQIALRDPFQRRSYFAGGQNIDVVEPDGKGLSALGVLICNEFKHTVW
jgi:hypothetical protein